MVMVGQMMQRKLVKVQTDTPVSVAAKLMAILNVGSVLVEARNRIVGIVTESDIVRKVIGQDRGHYEIPVEIIMSSPVIGIEERRPLTEAAELMDQHRTRHLAVMNAGECVGILSVRDLLRPVSADEL